MKNIAVISVAVVFVACLAGVQGAVKCPGGKGLKAGKCVDCANGYWSFEGSNVCQPCPAGTESPKSGVKNYCVNCRPLSYNPTKGGSCKPCPNGSYTDSEGAKACIKCTKRTTVNYPGPSCNDYIVCAPGKKTEVKYCKTNLCFLYTKNCCSDYEYKCKYAA